MNDTENKWKIQNSRNVKITHIKRPHQSGLYVNCVALGKWVKLICSVLFH